MSLPVLLYTIPRSRGTASLMRCKRQNKINEPFEVERQLLIRNALPEFWFLRLKKVEQTFDSLVDWNKIVAEMNSPDSCTKIHGGHLEFYRPGKSWYENVLATRSHSIFVVEREDRENMLLSMLLAHYHGWNTWEQGTLEIKPCTIEDTVIRKLKFTITSYIKNYPTYGTVVTFDTLPTEFFVPEKNEASDQHSYLRHHYITNLDFCKEIIADLLDYYKEEWDDKIKSIRSNA